MKASRGGGQPNGCQGQPSGRLSYAIAGHNCHEPQRDIYIHDRYDGVRDAGFVFLPGASLTPRKQLIFRIFHSTKQNKENTPPWAYVGGFYGFRPPEANPFLL